jgi:hypothetical protein
MSNITTGSIMRGRNEVSRNEVYSAFSRRGFDPALIDDELDAAQRMQAVAFKVLFASGFFLLLTGLSAAAFGAHIPAMLLSLETTGLIIGATVFAGGRGLESSIRVEKMDAAAVTTFLKEAKAVIEREHENLVYSNEYLGIVHAEAHLRKLGKSFKFDVELDERRETESQQEGEGSNEVNDESARE